MIDVVNIFGFRSRLNYLKCALEVLRKTSRTDVELVTIFSVENRDMPWYYGAADAMILCSDSEGSPTSVKEASHRGDFEGRTAATRYDGTRTAERIVELYWAVARRFRTGEEHRSALRAAGLGVMTPAKKKRTSDKSHSWRGE